MSVTVEPSSASPPARRVLLERPCPRGAAVRAPARSATSNPASSSIARACGVASCRSRRARATLSRPGQREGEQRRRASSEQRERDPAPAAAAAVAPTASAEAPRRRRTGGRGDRGEGGGAAGAPPGSASAASSAARNASAAWKRCAGSFASARITTASSAGGTCGLSALGGRRRLGDLLQRDRDGAVALERDAAGEHLVEDHADRVDVRAPRSPAWPCACSGDRYCAVPMTEPVSVISEAPARAIPKSVTLARPSSSTITFCGFRSRWTIPLRVGEARPRRGSGGRSRPPRSTVSPRSISSLQRGALDVLHRDVVGAVVLAAVEDADDVRVLEAGGGLTPRGGSARRTRRPGRSARAGP